MYNNIDFMELGLGILIGWEISSIIEAFKG
jgi:hypothetical protein